MATFVIVHGAWGGAWSWNKYVVPMLRQAGHDVAPVHVQTEGEFVSALDREHWEAVIVHAAMPHTTSPRRTPR